MPRYLRPNVPGATVFFTVALANRRSDLPLREIAALREAARAARAGQEDAETRRSEPRGALVRLGGRKWCAEAHPQPEGRTVAGGRVTFRA